MITIFYGMSGSFKLTTMTRSKNYKDDFKIYSDVKPHYGYINQFFKDIRQPSDYGVKTYTIWGEESEDIIFKEYKKLNKLLI